MNNFCLTCLTEASALSIGLILFALGMLLGHHVMGYGLLITAIPAGGVAAGGCWGWMTLWQRIASGGEPEDEE